MHITIVKSKILNTVAVEYWTIIECETYTPAQQMITDKNEHVIIITTPSNCLTQHSKRTQLLIVGEFMK